jgi:hemerythrin
MICWTPSLAIGVAQIDAQHEALFAHATSFDAAVNALEPSDRLAELFGFLSRYAVEQCEAEERLMRESDYPGIAEQVSEHAEFKRRLASLVPHWESEGDSPALLLALTGFLDLWLRNHLASSDQLLGSYLRARQTSG